MIEGRDPTTKGMTMNTVRARIATAAVFVGLGGLGSYAMATNPARDAQGAAPRVASTQGASAATTSTPVVTQSSGAPLPTVPAVAQAAPATKPVVTHTSGGGPGRKHAIERDDGVAAYED